jgi:hypothetical protein
MHSSEIHKIIEQLQGFVEKESFKGYDPYDTLNAKFPFHWFGKWGQVLAIQMGKRAPINFRPLLGIKKDFNPKAMGLFLQAYSLYYKIHPNEKIKSICDYLFNWLKENHTKGYSGMCWGYNFGWASPVKYLAPFSPTIVVTGFVAKGMWEYYETFKNQEVIEVLKSALKFIENDLEWTNFKEGKCISYSTKAKDCCYNASMLGAELYARLYSITGEESYKKVALELTDFVVSKQKNNGVWYYSFDPYSNTERKQIDFHQGYVLDAIFYVQKFCLTNKYTTSLEKGLAYYKNNQFRADGWALWRVPKVYPLEIHNQSQAILTFTRLRTITDYSDFCKVIIEKTIEEMWDKRGWFFDKKYPLYTIKTPMIRWSEAWMLLALTEWYVNNKE